jgi:alpha-galactosidase
MDTVRFEVMKQFGYFVTESTRHMSEYTPYFRSDPEVLKQFNLDQVRQDLSRRTARVDTHYEQLRKDGASSELMKPVRSDEYACRIIEAMETGRPTVINANVSNTGLISNLPEGSCVEVPCTVDGLGVHPMAVGSLPPQCASLSRANVAVQEMATIAITDLDRESAFHAIALDPLTAANLSLGEIRQMFDEMWTANGDALARYE